MNTARTRPAPLRVHAVVREVTETTVEAEVEAPMGGPALGATDKASGLHYHDYAFPDGYTYRVLKESGEVQIIKSPRSKGPVLITVDEPATKAKILQIIDEQKTGKRNAAIKTGASAAQAIIAAVTAGTKTKKMKAAPVTNTVEETPAAEVPEEESSFPVGPAIGVGLAVLLGLAYAMTRSGK